MGVEALHRLCRLLLVVVYAAATTMTAASPIAACPTLDLDHHFHAGHDHGPAHGNHGKHHPTSEPADCVNCCIGACLLAASLPPPASTTASSAFYGALIVYPSNETALADRSIPPDPAPPKPTSRT